MKEEHWEEPEDTGKEFFDSVAVLQNHEVDDQTDKRMRKQRITELRRRAEERLDWKRIAGEYDFNFDLDNGEETVDES